MVARHNILDFKTIFEPFGPQSSLNYSWVEGSLMKAKLLNRKERHVQK